MVHAYKGFLGIGTGGATPLTDLRQTIVAARVAHFRFIDCDFQESRGEEFDPESGRRETEKVALGNYDLKVKATLEPSAEGVPYLARSLMGALSAVTTEATTGKRVTATVADTHSVAANQGTRLSVERKFGTAAYSHEANAVVSKLGLNGQQPGFDRWEVEMIGSSPARRATASTPSLPLVAAELTQRVTTFTLDGVSTARPVRSFRWDIMGGNDEDDYDVTSQHRRDAEYGEFTATFQAEATFIDDADMRRFWGISASSTTPADTDTEYACNIKTVGKTIGAGPAKYEATIDMPAVFLTGVSTPLRGKSPIRQTINGRAIYAAASSKAADVSFLNAAASYT